METAGRPTPLPLAPSTPPTIKQLLQGWHVTPMRLLGMGLGITVVVLLLLRSLRGFDVKEFAATLASADLGWLMATVLLLLAGQSLRLARWHRLLRHESPSPLRPIGKSLMDGQLINWLSPVRLGDVWRAWRIVQLPGRGPLWSVGSIVMEKTADTVALGVLSLVLVAAPPPIETSSILVRLVAAAFAGALFLLVLVAVKPGALQQRAIARLPQWMKTRLAPDQLALPASVRDALRRPSIWLEAVAYSLAIWLVALLTNTSLANALQLALTPSQHVLLLIALQLGLILSTVPANFGLFPVVTVGVFGLFGMSDLAALAFGTALYVLVYGVNFALWLFWATLSFVDQRRRKPTIAPQPVD